MLNVLLVDDEPFIRKGLAIILDWESEGFCIAGEASDGEQALGMLRQKDYDLVLTDINMPGMGGFGLLEAARAEGIDTHFAIVSGYNDFENAKRAMQFGCVDFLSKPVNSGELSKVLASVRADCEKHQRDELEERARDKAMLERHLLPLLAGRYDSINVEYIRENMELKGKLRYINIELDMNDLNRLGLDETHRRALQRRLYDVIIGFMGSRSDHIIFDVNKSADCYDVGFIYTEQLAAERSMDERGYMKWFLDEIVKGMESSDCRVQIQMGAEVDDIEHISSSYNQASVAKLMTGFSGADEPAADSAEEELFSPEHQQVIDELLASIERCDYGAIDSLVGRLYEVFASPDMDYKSIRQNIHYLMFNLIHEGIERNPGANQDEMMHFLASSAFDSGISRGSQSHFRTFCRQYADYLSEKGGVQGDSGGSSVLAQVEKEINENYMNNISLKSLSEKLFINSAYLGQLFRKKYGKTFKEYLNEVRIEKAAELLRTTNLRVYQISEMVGYQSLDYFINKFVQIKKHTPTQYRKKII